ERWQREVSARVVDVLRAQHSLRSKRETTQFETAVDASAGTHPLFLVNRDQGARHWVTLLIDSLAANRHRWFQQDGGSFLGKCFREDDRQVAGCGCDQAGRSVH